MTDSRLDNALGFWSGWRRYALALGALLFLFALLFWAFAELNRHNKDIQTGGNNSPFWRIGEVETALLRYINAMDLYRSLDPESSPVAVVDTYEVLLTRVSLFQNPNNMNAVAEIDGATASLNALYGELINLQPQMELLAANGLTGGQIKAIRESMNGFAWEFSGYPREAMQVQERLISDVQRKVRNTYNLLALIFLFIVATGGIIAFFVFRERSLAIETQNYLATAIETMPDAFALYDGEDRLVLSNQRFRQNHGMTLDEAQSGPEFAALLKRDLNAKRFPAAETDPQSWLAKRVAHHNNPSAPFEEPFMRDRWLQIAERRTRRGEVVSIATDVTQLKRRELELEESTVRFRQLAEASFDGIVVVEDRRINRFNDHLNEIFGWNAAELQGEPIDILFAPGTEDAWNEALGQKVLRARETLAQHKDGHVFNVELSSRAIDHSQAHSEIVFSIRDISERKQAETEMRAAKDAAEAGSRAKSDFLAMMSHEIRTPMNAIMGMTTMLMHSDLDPQQKAYATTAQDSAEGLLVILNDLLDLSKLEAGKLNFEEANFDLPELALGVMELLSSHADEKGLSVHGDWHDLTHPRVKGDPTRVRQLLLNLLGNAIKFTEEGNVTLRITQEAPEQGNDGRIGTFVEVIDTGIGISREHQARLFEPFSQADATVNRRFGGTGLGLAICRRLVDAMGGEIGVASEAGKGATFWFRLEFDEATGEAITLVQDGEHDHLKSAARSTTSVPLKHQSRKPTPHGTDNDFRRVLLVEDSPTNRAVVEAFLEDLPIELEMAENGKEGLEKAAEGAYDLILMDMAMPVMDGLTSAREIRQLPGLSSKTPIVALTANAMESDRQRCLDAGMNDYLAKPLKLGSLVKIVSRWLALDAPAENAAPKAELSDWDAVEDTAIEAVSADSEAGSVDDNDDVTPPPSKRKTTASAAPSATRSTTKAIKAKAKRTSSRTRTPEPSTKASPAASASDQNAMVAGKPAEDDGYDLEIRARAERAIAASGTHVTADDGKGAPEAAAEMLVDEAVLDQMRDDTGEDIVRMLVTSFLEELEGRMPKVVELCETEDWAGLRHEAHTIKGSAATFGAAALSKTAKRIEVACDNDDHSQAKADMADFPALARQTRESFVKTLKLKLPKTKEAA